MSTLESYREQVRDATLRRDGRAILNGSVDHAAVIVQEAFSSAQRGVSILSYRLDPDCYAREGVRNAAKFFLADRDHHARFLLEASLWDQDQNFEWGKHPLLADLKDFANSQSGERLQVRAVPKEWASRYAFNFMVMDDYGFRYEEDRKRAAAVAAFMPEGGDKTVQHLAGIFDELWGRSRPLDL